MLLGLDDGLWPRDADVVIVGLGPVGATAALTLARAGLQVVIFEKDEGDGSGDLSESRASTFHPPTLEILDDLGVADDLHKVGLIAATYQYRDRTEGLVAEFDLAAIAGDTRFPYRLQSEQQNLVRIIRDRLAGLPNAFVVQGAQVTGTRQTGDIVEVLVEPAAAGDGRGGAAVGRARWVIAADGSHSVVRRGLGIDFPGMTYPEQFLVVSTTEDFAELIPGIAPVNYFSDPREWLVLLRTPLHWRVLFPIPENEAEGAALEPAAVQRRLQSVAPLPRDYQISHTRIYRVHQRVADRFRVGRVLLAGDAAHINNPLGGMGMNSGIHDAAAAAAAILAAERDGRSDPAAVEALLDDYAQTRRSVALDYVRAVTHRNYEVLQEADPQQRRREHDEMRRTAADPALARAYLLRTSMLAARVPTAAAS